MARREPGVRSGAASYAGPALSATGQIPAPRSPGAPRSGSPPRARHPPLTGPAAPRRRVIPAPAAAHPDAGTRGPGSEADRAQALAPSRRPRRAFRDVSRATAPARAPAQPPREAEGGLGAQLLEERPWRAPTGRPGGTGWT